MNQKIKVLFILPSLKRAGAETQTVDLINGLDNQVFEKHLLSFEEGLDLLDKVDKASVTFHHLPRQAKFDWPLAGEIGKLIDAQGFEAIHCSLTIGLFYGWLGLRRAKRKVPLIAALHTTINPSRRADLFDIVLYQWLLRGCAKVVFVCEAQLKHWQNRFPFLLLRSLFIHNGIDADYFSPHAVSKAAVNSLRSELAIPDHCRVICHIAAFRPEKGQLLLLEAFKTLKLQYPDLHLVMAGEGMLKPFAAERVQSLQLTDCVHLPGALTDVRPLLALSDWSVLPSTSETFSMAMLESLAMGVPMVATAVGGACEAIIPGETGYLAKANDIESLANALQAALANPNRDALGINGRERVVKLFNRAQMLSQYERLIKDVASKSLPNI